MFLSREKPVPLIKKALTPTLSKTLTEDKTEKKSAPTLKVKHINDLGLRSNTATVVTQLIKARAQELANNNKEIGPFPLYVEQIKLLNEIVTTSDSALSCESAIKKASNKTVVIEAQTYTDLLNLRMELSRQGFWYIDKSKDLKKLVNALFIAYRVDECDAIELEDTRNFKSFRR